MGKRGFIGPLGDDIPALFPIIAGIMLFIGTVWYVNGIVDQKNSILETRKAVLGLSYIVTETGLIKDQSEFTDTCEKLKKYASGANVKFLVTLKRYCTSYDLKDASGVKSPFYVENWPPAGSDLSMPASPLPASGFQAGRTWLYCTSISPISAGPLAPEPKEYVLLQYPVAVPCQVDNLPTNGLGLINVIAWKK